MLPPGCGIYVRVHSLARLGAARGIHWLYKSLEYVQAGLYLATSHNRPQESNGESPSHVKVSPPLLTLRPHQTGQRSRGAGYPER